MREAVAEEHEGKRRNELSWKIHRLHWEKNRFVFDLMYKRKVMTRQLVRGVVWNQRGDLALPNCSYGCGFVNWLLSLRYLNQGNAKLGRIEVTRQSWALIVAAPVANKTVLI